MSYRIGCIFLALAVCISLYGCGGRNDKTEENIKNGESVSVKTEDVKAEESTDKIIYSNIDEAISAQAAVVSMTETERENPNYFSGLKSYSLVYDTENGTVEVFVLAPDDAINNNYGAIIWCPDAKITDYRFAEIAADGYIVFAVYFRGYDGSQSEGIRDFGGDKDLCDLELLLDIITECDFIDKTRIVTVSGVMNCIKASRLLATEKGREHISGAAFAQPVADLPDYLEKLGEEAKTAFIENITDGNPERCEEELLKRNMLEIVEGIESYTELLIVSFGEGDESGVPTEYSEMLKDKFDELGVYYDEYHFDFAGTDFYVPESIGVLREWLLQKFD